MNKLLQNDEENASVDVQLLCKLWSDESASYHFASENTREIEANTAFSILGHGATQIQNAEMLIYKMDKGHGLLDRFIISVPRAFKPTPEEELSSAHIADIPLKDFDPILTAVAAADKDIIRTHVLDASSTQLDRNME